MESSGVHHPETISLLEREPGSGDCRLCLGDERVAVRLVLNVYTVSEIGRSNSNTRTQAVEFAKCFFNATHSIPDAER